MNEMLAERRDWINHIMEERVFTSLKIPENLQGFYERNKTDEERAKESEELTKKKSKKDKSAKKIKDTKKGKKGKKSDKDGETRVYVGPSEVNNKFEFFEAEYKHIWENRDEEENFEQNYDVKLLKSEFKPAIMKQYQ